MNETPNTQLARMKIGELTNKPIRVTSVQEFASSMGIKGVENYLGAAQQFPDHYLIAINPEKPETNETTFVHEVIHLLLDQEGYPSVYPNLPIQASISEPLREQLPKLGGYLSSVLDHPEVYRRMADDYDLDMSEYFDGLVEVKTRRFGRGVSNNKHAVTFSNQQDMLDGIEYFYYMDTQKETVMDLFRKHSPSAYTACAGIHKAICKIGMRTPQECHRSAHVLLERIRRYGEKRGLPFNNVWDAFLIR